MKVLGDYNFSSISGPAPNGRHTCGIDQNGTPLCWGENLEGSSGTSAWTANITSPVHLSRSDLNFTAMALGDNFSCGIDQDNAPLCWGYNIYGQLGDGSVTIKKLPTPVMGGYTFSKIDTGEQQTCGMDPSGTTMLCWGANMSGQLGNGSENGLNYIMPGVVTGVYAFADISTSFAYEDGSGHSCGVDTNGMAQCWGAGSYGRLGDGGSTTQSSPVKVIGDYNFIQIGVGEHGSCALDKNGAALCWGRSQFGENGAGTTTQSTSPITVIGDYNFREISRGRHHVCGVDVNGMAQCWGFNNSGYLGDDTTDDKTTPVTVIGEYNFGTISAGYNHSCGIDANGEAYCWGEGGSHQLGYGSTTDQHTPVKVVGDYNFSIISAGYTNTCAIDTNGTAMCWGANTNYGLGDGTTTTRQTPVPVSGDYNFTSISPGISYTCGVLVDGTGLCWGMNNHGQLGSGGTNEYIAKPVIRDIIVGKSPNSFALASTFDNNLAVFINERATWAKHPSILDEAWHHITMSYDQNGSAKVFVDGTESGSFSNQKTEITSEAKSLLIGRGTNGYIDEVKIYNKALNAEEIAIDFNSWATSSFHSEVKDMNSAGTIQGIQWDVLFGSKQLEALNSDVNLIGWWKFNDEDSNAVNVQCDNNSALDGLLAEGADLNGTGWDDTNAGFFDGVDDYVEIGDITSTENINQLTVTAWVKTRASNSDAARTHIVSDEGQSITDTFGLWWETDEDIEFHVWTGDGDAQAEFGDGFLNEPNVWKHLVGTYDGSTIRVYVNAVEGQTSANLTGTTLDGTAALRIGKRSTDDSGLWNGQIDEVRIYSRTLTLSEIHTLYAAGLNDLNVSVRVCDDPSCQGLNDGSWAEFDVGNRYQSLDANVGLVLDINFNDVNGSSDGVLDASPYGSDGLLIGGADINSLGKDNTRAGFFDGVDDYVDLGEGDGITELQAQLTVSAWAKWAGSTSAGNNNAVVSQSGEGDDVFALAFGSGDDIYFYVENSSDTGEAANSDTDLPDNDWHHYVGVYDGAKVLLYIDGVLQDDQPALTGLTQTVAHNIRIGTTQYATANWEGQIDDVKIYNRALSEGEIMGFYIKGSPMKYVQYRAEFDHQDANYPIGYGYLNDVGLEYNRVPDANVGAVDGYDAQEGLPVFNYATDGNLTIDFNVFDWDGNNGMTAELFYSTNRGYGNSTKIQSGLKLTDICTKMDFNTFDQGMCNWDWNITGITDANYYVGVTVTDTVGNTDYNLTTYSFALDSAGPTTRENVTSDENTDWQNTDANIQFNCTDTTASCGNLYYSLDDTNYQFGWGADLNIGIALATDANHEIFFWSSDTSDNNEAAKLIYLALDKTSPTVSITDPASGGSQTATSVTITYTGTDTNSDVNKYWVKADSGNWIGNGTNLTYTFSGQTRAPHTYYLKATDNADNNSSEASVTVTISAVATTTTTTPEGPGGITGSTSLGTTPTGTSTPATPAQIEEILTDAGLSQAQIKQALEANTKLNIERTIRVEKERTLVGTAIYRTIVTIKATSLHTSTITGIRIIENIPKGTVEGQLSGAGEDKANLAEISSQQAFTVLKENQILEFIIERLEPNGTAIITYTISNRVMETENWPAPVAAGFQERVLCQGIECRQRECKNARCNPTTGRCNYSNQADGMRCGQNGECEEGNCVEKPLPPQPPTTPLTATDLTTPITILAGIGIVIAAGLGINYFKGKRVSKPKRRNK